MKKFLLSIPFTCFTFSCSTDSNIKAQKAFFSQNLFDSSVIQSLPLYDSLKVILHSNIDTIFKFKNNESQTNSQYYHFHNSPYSPEDMRLENMPSFLYYSVERIFKALGDKKINGFTLWTDSTLEINVRNLYKPEENIDGAHSLIWKDKFNYDSTMLRRDTIIAPRWTYQIWVGEHKAR